MTGRVWFAFAVAAAVGTTAGLVAGKSSGDSLTSTATSSPSTGPPTSDGAEASLLPPGPVSGDLEVGATQMDLAVAVGAAGGDIVVSDGDLKGMTLSVPAGAFVDGTALSISHAPIIADTYGDAVTALSPLIEVAVNGAAEARASVPLVITVPATLPDGFFGMGLLRDGLHRLEGMPVLEWDERGITMLSSQLGSFFLSAVRPSDLPDDVFTGYMVATDNWQFVNEGSWLSPGGICAGMSISSMWYFLEQRRALGSPALYRQFDFPHGTITPWFGRDDAHAIRMASMVQNDIRWGSTVWDSYRSLRYEDIGWYQYQAFRYSMYLTNEPQYATLGISPTVSGGHAVVAYGYSGSTIWIADPNFPFHLNSFEFVDSRSAFAPYISGLTASDSTVFNHIGYAAKRALVDWALVGQRYAELLAGTVGDVSFPATSIGQRFTDPATGARSWQRVTRPTVDADGTVTLVIGASPLVAGDRVAAQFITPGTEDVVQTSWAHAAAGGGLSVTTPAVLNPGISGGQYTVVIWASNGGTGMAIVDTISVDIDPLPAPTTTTTEAATTTAPPATVTPTAPPTTPPTTPPTEPPYDCSACPEGIPGLDCRLHCEGI